LIRQAILGLTTHNSRFVGGSDSRPSGAAFSFLGLAAVGRREPGCVQTSHRWPDVAQQPSWWWRRGGPGCLGFDSWVGPMLLGFGWREGGEGTIFLDINRPS
jgi:hypothetical protein